MPRLLLLVLILTPLLSQAEEKATVSIKSHPLVPKKTTVVFVEPGKPGPANKDHKAVATAPVGSETKLPPGQYDVYLVPPRGNPVLLQAGWKLTATLSPGELVGSVYVRGDDLPRAAAVVLTATDDSGPGEKGHKPIQRVGDYKEDMLVLPGFYAVWIEPANGAKAQKIADKIRVLAGREVKVPEE